MYPSANPCACDLVGLREGGGTVTGEAISGALTQISVLVRGDETSAQSAQATSPPGRQVLALARRSQASPVSARSWSPEHGGRPEDHLGGARILVPTVANSQLSQSGPAVCRTCTVELAGGLIGPRTQQIRRFTGSAGPVGLVLPAGDMPKSLISSVLWLRGGRVTGQDAALHFALGRDLPWYLWMRVPSSCFCFRLHPSLFHKQFSRFDETTFLYSIR